MLETKKYLKKLGITETDKNYISTKRFNDKGQYRIEIPGIQSPEALESLLCSKYFEEVTIHRVTQTKGIMLLTDNEILKMGELANNYKLELFLSVGPRATYDTSATAQTSEGKRIGYRLRGYDNLVYAIEDVKRAINLGIKGILLYDEGLLYILNKMREDKIIPQDIHFKLSAHAGCSNPASAKLFENTGLNSLNPVRDLQIPMIASIRDAISIPLDIHTENPKSTGGFIRHYEVPEIIKVGSPVYLKTGGSIAKQHNWDTTTKEATLRLKQVILVNNIIERYCDDVIMSPEGSSDLAIPKL